MNGWIAEDHVAATTHGNFIIQHMSLYGLPGACGLSHSSIQVRRKTMSFWFLLGIVFIAGAVGGVIGSFVNGKPSAAFGFLPGFVLNTLIGAVAASVSWLLYGPLSQAQIGATPGTWTMAASTLGGAVLVGMVGSAWLTKAVGQKLFQAAAYNAAAAPASLDLAARMLTEGPSDALKIAKSMNQGGAAAQPAPSQNGLLSEPVAP
jgi:hypothetical protein